MFAKLKKEGLTLDFIVRTAPALVLSLAFLTVAANAQTVSNSSSSQTKEAEKVVQENVNAVTTPALVPVLKNYREIAIGMAANDVKDKLGKAKIADKDGFYYEISDGETAQIVLDTDQKVRVISVTYDAKNGNAPKLEDVLGADQSVEPGADGRIYRLVRYPEAGFWVAYSRTAGDNATVTITIQKL